MKSSSARLAISWFIILAAGASQARADYLNWSYSSDPNVPGVTASPTSPSGGGTVSLTDYTNHAGGLSIPVIAYLTSTSSATPITFNPSGSPSTTYNMALTLTDNATHDSRTLNFNGSIAGTLSATTSTLVNTLAPASNSVTFDGHKYTVSIPSVALAAPTSPQQNIFATVHVVPTSTGTGGGNQGGGNTGGGNTGGGHGSGGAGTPEPTSLVLGSLGFTFVGLGCWRRRRRR
jgi:hypothetical protein